MSIWKWLTGAKPKASGRTPSNKRLVVPKIGANEERLSREEATALLYEACAEADVSTVKFLLGMDPDINSRAWNSSFSPLHVCVSGTDGQDRQSIVKLLVEAGADLEAQDAEKGLTPLHYAALRNKALCADMLLKCGANVHAVERVGATALHAAAMMGSVDVAKVLLRHGADPNRTDSLGHSPKSLAKSRSDTKFLALFG